MGIFQKEIILEFIPKDPYFLWFEFVHWLAVLLDTHAIRKTYSSWSDLQNNIHRCWHDSGDICGNYNSHSDTIQKDYFNPRIVTPVAVRFTYIIK